MPVNNMTVTSSAIVNGKIVDKYGKHGDLELSFPIKIEDAPKEAKSFAIEFYDDDAIPVAGHSWTHWLVANLTDTRLAENVSKERRDFVQGQNSSGNNRYEGPQPPDKAHTYTLTVYALDSMLDLKEGFTREQLHKAIDGHILQKEAIQGAYTN